MKAYIRTDGMLIIAAENSTESFALSSWWNRYPKHPALIPDPNPTGLGIEPYEEPDLSGNSW